MIWTLLTGAGAGLGITFMAYGLRPPRLSLSEALSALHRPPSSPLARRQRVYAVLAAPLARLGLPRSGIRHDLALVERGTTEHLAEQMAATLAGLLAAPAVVLLLGLGGQVPLWLALAGAAVGFRWADTRLRNQAARRRAQLRQALSVLLDLVTISLAGGTGLQQALDDAVGIGDGWAADRLRRAVTTARLLRQPPWEPLGQLGRQTAVTDLEELAATLDLAGSEGSRIRASMAARATAMRSARTAANEAAAVTAAGRMALPLALLGLGYLIFLLYPPIVTLSTSL